MKEKPEELIIDGKRIDDRAPEEIRPLKIEAGILKKADGSAYVELGNNRVIAAAYGPRELHPRHLQRPDRALLNCRYDMAPFAVEERKRPGPSRRSKEISKVSTEALEPAIFLRKYPRAGIDVTMEVLQADAGTRTAAITAASVALADGGIPMRDLVASIAAGKVDGTIVLDLCNEEDQWGEADMPIAYMPQNGHITLLQMDGNFSSEEFERSLELAIKGCEEVYEKQREALKKKYAKEGEEE